MPNQDDKVFKCQNPNCLKESCRFCKEESHIPLRCNEVEKKGKRDLRLVREEAMANARIRKCVSCNTPYFKDEGCNKIVCSCKASKLIFEKRNKQRSENLD